MFRTMWRGFASRKLRVVLTGVAIALGVALMAGTYILTDTMNASFANIDSATNAGNSAVITPRNVLGSNDAAQISPIGSSLLAKARAVPGVAKAAGEIFSTVTLLDARGQSLNPAAPAFVTSVLPAPFSSATLAQGRLPSRAGEAAIDQETAARAHLSIGSVLTVAGAGATRRDEVVGTYRVDGVSSFGGASVAVLTLTQAQAAAGEVGRYDQIDVAAAPGVSPEQLRDRLAKAMPASVVVRTGAQQAAQEDSQISNELGFLRTFLLVFAYVALFVGGFIIFNTFSITIAQRTRELGLLRAVGASRRQVLASVVTESLLLGLGGSVFGLLAGLAVAPGLDRLFKSFGADLPYSGTVLETRTITVSLIAGILASVLAGLAPALRATRVPPVAAMREGVAPERGRLARHALPISVSVFGLGALMLAGGLAGERAALAGAGALVVFIGVALISPRLVPPLARAVGALVAWRGVTGKLAQENARRQPGRTAATSAALMIGLALVTFVSIVAASTNASIGSAVNASFAGNLIVEASSTASNVGIPAALAPVLSRARGVAVVSPVAFSEARVTGTKGTETVTGVDSTSLSKLYKLKWDAGGPGALADLGDNGTVLTHAFASANHLRVGEALSVLTASGKHLRLVVRGIVTDRAGLLFGPLTVSRSLVETSFSQSNDGVDFIGYTPGATNRTVQPAVDRILTTAFPQAKSMTAAQFKQQEANQVNTLLALIYVLLALAVIVSLFGLVNTLVLSVHERTREFGMLRAVGASRRQVRQTVRYESVITSLIGAVTGLAMGALFGSVIIRSLGSAGSVLSVPFGTLAALAILAAMAGVVAAVLPARRASRLDVLYALSSE
jgi:putative ABC transport system permease protein